MSDKISIIMPVLDNAEQLAMALAALQPLRARGHEVIVADGGSRDGSITVARRQADRLVVSGAGRALQMNSGAGYAQHEILLFLHVDTELPEQADKLVSEALRPGGSLWGYFDLCHPGGVLLFRLLDAVRNWHCALTGTASGKQAIFVTRSFFERVGGYDDLQRLEGLALSRKLRSHVWPCRIKTPVLRANG